MRVFAFFLMVLPFQEPAAPVFYETLEGNAADVYLSLKRLGKDHPFDEKEVLSRYVDEGIGDRDAVRAALAPYEDVFTTAERAVRMKRCAWDHPGLHSIGGDTPHLLVAIKLSTLFSARALLRLGMGEVDAALDDVLALGRIGSDFMQDRLYITVLAGKICINRSHMVWLRGLAHRDPGAAALRRAEAHLSRLLDRHPTPIPAIEQEKGILLGSVDRMVTDLPGFLWDLGVAGPRGAKKDLEQGLWAEIGTALTGDPEAARKVLRRRFEEAYADLLFDAAQPLTAKERRHVGAEERQQLESRWRVWKRTGKDKAEGIVVAADVVVAAATAAVNFKLRCSYAEGKLMLDLQRARCRLELLRLKTGAYPDAIDAAQSVTDPFTGHPVTYSRIVDPRNEAFVLAREGPKADAKERVRVLSQECGFDYGKFEREEGGELVMSMVWARRPR